jgi:hypothetical protein
MLIKGIDGQMIKNMDNPMVFFWLDEDHNDCKM